MNKIFFNIALLIACITLLVCSLFCMHVQLQKEKTPLQVNVSDTLRFRVKELENEITVLHGQRFALIRDTARIYKKYNELVLRINADTTPKQQYETLKELTDIENPKANDVNQKLAEGILCADLLINSKAQLALADSVSALQDSVIVTQKTELNEFKTSLSNSLKESKEKDHGYNRVKRKSHVWRGFALIQCAAITSALIIYKLSH